MNKATGYKVAHHDGKCRGFQYEVGGSYTHNGEISLCNEGFHFCLKPADCFNYYGFDSNNKVFEIEASDKIIHGDDKSVTNSIKIVRELAWSEVLAICNEGKDNTGLRNTGDCNTGGRNTGNCNTGDWNTGNWNTGGGNTGNRNTGNCNTGDCNTGGRNTGNWNTGDCNTGDCNTGDCNTGNRNTGDCNTGNRNTGAFCTGEPPFTLFNKPSKWTGSDFKNSRAYELMRYNVDTKIWVSPSQMTEDEKKANPSWKTVGGYLKNIPFKEAFQNAWHNWDVKAREAFTSLPNFDAEIFKEITGVDIDA